MRRRLVAGSVLLVVVVAGGLWWLLEDSRRGSGSAALAARPVPALESTNERATVAEPLSAVEPASTPPPDAQRTAVEPAEPAASKPRASALAELRGRFVFEGGAPAVGVPCEVHGWGANQERQLKYGMPVDWIDPAGESDTNGCFSLEFDPPRAFQFTLDANLPGYAGVAWRWGEIQPSAVLDLGEITLLSGGTLEGCIVDRAGNPLLGQDWLVYARSMEAGAAKGRA